MSSTPDYPLVDGDLTAKARIRNAALTLHATKGAAATTMREVAQAAEVTHGLVVHHFQNKRGLQQAVEEYVVERVRHTFAEVPTEGDAAEIGRARVDAVTRMLEQEPVFVRYLQQTLLVPEMSDATLLATLADFMLEQVRDLREAGVANTDLPLGVHAASVLMRGLGPVLLLPVVTRLWDHLVDNEMEFPEIEVRIQPRRATPSDDMETEPVVRVDELAV